MTDDEKADKKSDEDRLAEALKALDALPPEELKTLLIESGLLDIALDSLRDIALHAEDPADRKNALDTIQERGLGIILLPDDE